MKKRNYCFTSFKTDFHHDKLPEGAIYMIYQHEKCPETGREHWQGYIELSKPCRINVVKQIINDDKAHIEERKGSQSDAIAYCCKDKSRIGESCVVLGKPAQQGRRTDLHDIAMLRKSQIVEEYPEVILKYSKGINELELIRRKNEQKLRLDISVTVMIGPPGCGKTRYVYDNYNMKDIYKLNTNSNGTLWWDGYDNEDIILIDDFYGWIKYTDLLTLLDIYPYRCQIKGSYCWANWTKVFITSNYNVDTWYGSVYNIEALKRRINKIIILDNNIHNAEKNENQENTKAIQKI